MVVFLKRNNLMNLCLLLLVVFSLFLLDYTKLNQFIGYKRVKELVLYDYNFNNLSVKLFGKNIFNFYDFEVNVSNNIIKEIEYEDYSLVYQTEEKLYSTYIGSVYKIDKNKDGYDLYINLLDGKLVIYDLTTTFFL